jgi:hypothetical protein
MILIFTKVVSKSINPKEICQLRSPYVTHALKLYTPYKKRKQKEEGGEEKKRMKNNILWGKKKRSVGVKNRCYQKQWDSDAYPDVLMGSDC